jgi:hypothetical protein
MASTGKVDFQVTGKPTYRDLATSWQVIGVVRSQLFRGHRRADKASHATAGFG